MAYATAAELVAYLGDEDPPANAATLLDRASVDVDSVLIGAWYAVDDDGLPTDAAVIEALSRATCAQVHYWMESGNTSGVDTAGGWRDVSIGNVRLSRVAGGSGTEGAGGEFAPAAAKILRLAGLLPIAPMVYG